MQKFLKLFGDDRRSVFWITDQANIRADFFKPDTFEAGAVTCLRSASAAKSNDWSAGKNRSDVNLHLIDEPLVQRVAENISSSLDQYAGHVFLAELGQDRGQRKVTINKAVFGEAIFEEMSVARKFSGTSKHDTFRLPNFTMTARR